MRGARRTSLALLATCTAILYGTAAAHAEEEPGVGGSVPSVLGLSLGEPSELVRASVSHGQAIYTTLIPVEVTATEAPFRLSIADGEAISGRRRGHLVNGRSILSAPLQAAAARGPFRTLDASIDPLLAQWQEPVTSAAATIRLRQKTGGGVGAVRGYHKLLLVTISATEP